MGFLIRRVGQRYVAYQPNGRLPLRRQALKTPGYQKTKPLKGLKGGASSLEFS